MRVLLLQGSKWETLAVLTEEQQAAVSELGQACAEQPLPESVRDGVGPPWRGTGPQMPAASHATGEGPTGTGRSGLRRRAAL